jgi:hypothetical protein
MDKSSRSLVILAISLVVLAVIGYLAYQRITRDRAAQPPVSQYEVTQIDKSKLPDRFPGDLPLPEDAVITQNESMIAPDGRFQETRAYTVSLPLSEERQRFATYFQEQGWTVDDTKDLGTFAAFLAQRDGTSMQVSLVARGSSTAVTINVTIAPASSNQ